MKKEEPIDVIRKMNPGKWIPSGEEIAQLLRDREKEKEVEKENKG